MSSKLEKLLESIDPAKTYDFASARASNALNTFEMNSAQITDLNEFDDYIEKFFMHVLGEIGETKITTGPLMGSWYTMWLGILRHIYGPNALRAAFDMARTGKEGGLYAVLKALAMKTAEEASEIFVSKQVFDFWIGLSYTEQDSAIQEYLEKYGHLLPSEMTEDKACGLKANFEKVLNQHPLLLQKLRGIDK